MYHFPIAELEAELEKTIEKSRHLTMEADQYKEQIKWDNKQLLITVKSQMVAAIRVSTRYEKTLEKYGIQNCIFQGMEKYGIC